MNIQIEQPVSIGFGRVRVEWSILDGAYHGHSDGWGRKRATSHARLAAQQKLMRIRAKTMSSQYYLVRLSGPFAALEGKWFVRIAVWRNAPSGEQVFVTGFDLMANSRDEVVNLASSDDNFSEITKEIVNGDIERRLKEFYWRVK